MKIASTAKRIFDRQCKKTFATKSAISRPEQTQQNCISIRSFRGARTCDPGAYRTGCSVGGRSESSASFGASTILGRRIVKVEPRPGSLSTVMSPPIIWQTTFWTSRPSGDSPEKQALRENDCPAMRQSSANTDVVPGIGKESCHHGIARHACRLRSKHWALPVLIAKAHPRPNRQ
jgi:hypothetical protein